MHPVSHAESSALVHGGDASDFLPIHEWFDATKAQVCHVSHRMFRHHREGIGTAVQVFGDVVRRSDPALHPVDLQGLGIQHMAEDTSLGRCPTAADWILRIRHPAWLQPTRLGDPEDDARRLAEASAAGLGGIPGDWMPLHRWFLETAGWNGGDPAHLAMRHHAMGIFEAEALLGRTVLAGGRHVPLRVAAERHVRTLLGRIPTAADWCACLRLQSWMVPAPGHQDAG